MKRHERILARSAHIAFYLLLFARPLTGWAIATADLFNVLAALAVVHIAAALKHHFIDRDNGLRSMLPWSSRPRAR